MTTPLLRVICRLYVWTTNVKSKKVTSAKHKTAAGIARLANSNNNINNNNFTGSAGSHIAMLLHLVLETCSTIWPEEG